MPIVVETIASLRSHLRRARSDAARFGVTRPKVSLVPTMGALHDGHLALVERAVDRGEIVVVSVFVNPLQFGDAGDLERYPRTLEADLEKLAPFDVAIVFAPGASEMYPKGAVQTSVSAGDVGDLYEGRTRRGHFDGVLTVVAKLLNLVQPETIVFGDKDAQQVFLVKRMVADLNIDVAVATVPTVRDDDGLALSSRNRFLDARERHAARALSRSLEAAESAADRGPDAVRAAAQAVLTGDDTVRLDYLEIVVPSTFLPVSNDATGRAIVIVAALVGDTRLIDNTAVYLG
ncbi:pantoate--beta-alanine ligase [Marisediminicola sp. LYQ134]|uniref:pantoate--beta-alanine ligase n=1 Tax=unclassified Marisediminicola TaxID=2618316 RepID=UPI0039837460